MVSESHSLTNTLYKATSCMPKRAASFMLQHLLRSLRCSWAENPPQPPLPELHPWPALRHTGTTVTPSLPPAALLVALNTSKSDKKGRARAQNRTGGIKADGPDKGAIWIGIRGQSKVKKHKMEFFRFDKCGGNWLLLSQCLADA